MTREKYYLAANKGLHNFSASEIASSYRNIYIVQYRARELNLTKSPSSQREIIKKKVWTANEVCFDTKLKGAVHEIHQNSNDGRDPKVESNVFLSTSMAWFSLVWGRVGVLLAKSSIP